MKRKEVEELVNSNTGVQEVMAEVAKATSEVKEKTMLEKMQAKLEAMVASIQGKTLTASIGVMLTIVIAVINIMIEQKKLDPKVVEKHYYVQTWEITKYIEDNKLFPESTLAEFIALPGNTRPVIGWMSHYKFDLLRKPAKGNGVRLGRYIINSGKYKGRVAETWRPREIKPVEDTITIDGMAV